MGISKKKYFILFISIALSFFQILSSKAEEEVISLNSKVVKQLSLSDCLNRAMSNSPDVISSGEDIELSKARLSEARSGYMPRLSARAAYNYFNADQTFKFKLPDQYINVFSEQAVLNGLQQQALAMGVNPRTGTAINPNDLLLGMAAAQGTTPANVYQGMLTTARQQALASGFNEINAVICDNNLYNMGLSFQQPLFLWGKVYYSNKQAKEGIEIAKSNLIESRNDKLFDVVERYNQVLLSKELYRLADDTVIQFETLKDMVERAYNAKVEKVSKLDYLQVDAILGIIRSARFEMEKNVSLSKAALKQAMGEDDENLEIDTAEDKQSYAFVDVDLKDSMEKAFTNRPEFSKLKHGIKAKQYEIKSTKADNRPKVVFDTALNILLAKDYNLNPYPVNYRLSVLAEVPIFDGLRTRSKVQQIKHELNKLDQDNRKLNEGVTLQVTEAYLTREQSRKTLESIESSIKSAVENREMSRNGFELDIVETKRVIDAQVLEAMVKANRLQAIYNYNMADTRLKKVTGTIESMIFNTNSVTP